MFQARYINRFFNLFDKIEYGTLTIVSPDGVERTFAGKQPGRNATLKINDWRCLWAFMTKGDIGAAESYRDRLWDTDDLPSLLLLGFENEHIIGGVLKGGVVSNLVSRLAYLFKLNTLNGSKKNIHAHYDIGNDFYKLWLDETMTYSSALYNEDSETLVQAQNNKYDRLINRIENCSGTLLEVGCGWGGFAERALTHKDKDLQIKGITLSSEQQKYAQDRVANDAVIALEDYRNQTGKYDNLVSIEMFEAVGEKFWPTYFSKMKSLLSNKGKALIQTITIEDWLFEQYRSGGDMIRTYIFPGGMLPSKTRFIEEAEKAEMRVTDQFAFGKDYAKTLGIWLESFDAKQKEVQEMGFDDPFVRIWRFYLASCFAAFTVGRINVMHMELQHA